MKKSIFLILLIILMASFKVNALECDYLNYITTTDTIAYTESPETYDIKKDTEFKMCYQQGAGSIVEFSDDTKASYVKEGTYKLKEEFDIKKAHSIKKEYIVNKDTDVFSDPSAITKTSNILKDTKVEATYYYGPYIYITSSEVKGWVYTEYLSDNSAIENDKVIKEDTSNEDTTSNKSSSIYKYIIISLIAFIGIIALTIFYRKNTQDKRTI